MGSALGSSAFTRRVVKRFKTDSGGDAAWSSAKDVAGDVVLEQVETAYDANGNPLLTHARHRFHDATGTGELRPRTSTVTPSRSRYAARSSAKDVAGDVVLEQVETTYDANGNPILTHARHRFHDATGTGELRPPTSTTTPSRSQYAARWFDAANRLTTEADVGTNGGAAYARPAAVPARSDAAVVTSHGDA